MISKNPAERSKHCLPLFPFFIKQTVNRHLAFPQTKHVHTDLHMLCFPVNRKITDEKSDNGADNNAG